MVSNGMCIPLSHPPKLPFPFPTPGHSPSSAACGGFGRSLRTTCNLSGGASPRGSINQTLMDAHRDAHKKHPRNTPIHVHSSSALGKTSVSTSPVTPGAMQSGSYVTTPDSNKRTELKLAVCLCVEDRIVRDT